MAPRDPRILLSPDPEDDQIIVSRQKLDKLLREKDEEIDRLRRELERLRPALEKSREKNSKLSDKADQLQGKLEGLQNSLAVLGTNGKTAAAVGVPSSRTFFKQPRPPPEERRKPGGQPGHPGTTRPRPTPNAPERVLSLRACPHCSTRLGEPCGEWRHTITDAPAWALVVFDLVFQRYKCSGCGERVHAPIPEGYRGDFGPGLKTLVAELRALGLSHEKIREFLEMTLHLAPSEATLLAMEEGVAESLDGTYQALGEELRDATRTPNAEGDETSFPVDGETEQVWVGVSPITTVYLTQHDRQVEKGARSGDAAARMWEGYTGTLTHDGLASYTSVKGADHQWCLVHLNRELQKVEAAHGIEVRGFRRKEPPKFTRAGRPPREFLKFAAGARARWRKEVQWVEGHPASTLRRRERRYRRAVRRMGRFLARPWTDEDVVRIAGTMRKGLETIFTFVRLPGVPWSSNGAERELKVPVGIRKTQGGRKTERGTWVMDRILTVWRTCRKRGLRFWDVVLERLMWTRSARGPPLPASMG